MKTPFPISYINFDFFKTERFDNILFYLIVFGTLGYLIFMCATMKTNYYHNQYPNF